MWLLYLYFIREALIELYQLINDSLEWAFAGAEQPYLPTISSFFDTLQDYGVVIVLNGSILIVWALYNQVRFRGHDRHRSHEPVGVSDLAQLYGRPTEEIARWHQSRILTMQHAPDGTLVRVISRDAEKVPPTHEQGSRLEAS